MTSCLALAREQVERSWDASRAFFGRMPHDNCDVRPVEEFREQDTPLGFYNPPTEDGSRRGAYYINTSDLPGRPLHHIASLTYHEANPGHHFQLSIEQEIPDRPALRRFGGILASSAFAEGWGLYSERLADEMGLYLNDWERLGMLEAQGMRAARLVTDTGIHALGWSREQAIDAMEAIGTPHIDAVIEIDRYIAIPAQALSYMIGMIEIERARRVGRRARRRRVLAPRLPRPVARAGSAPAAGAPSRARLSPSAPSRRRSRGLHSAHHRPPTRGGAACSTSTSGSVRRSPWRT